MVTSLEEDEAEVVEGEGEIVDALPDQLEDELEISEAAALKMPTVPKLPPHSDQQLHRRTHWPYRSWCRFCNEGRGLGEQRGGSGQPHTIPLIGIDYFYITADGFRLRKDLKYPVNEEGEEQ